MLLPAVALAARYNLTTALRRGTIPTLQPLAALQHAFSSDCALQSNCRRVASVTITSTLTSPLRTDRLFADRLRATVRQVARSGVGGETT